MKKKVEKIFAKFSNHFFSCGGKLQDEKKGLQKMQNVGGRQ